MQQLRASNFWRSFLLTLTGATLLLPLMTYGFINYGGTAVDLALVPSATGIDVVLTNPAALPLNTFSVELRFDPNEFTVTDSDVRSPLCDERFIMQHTIDNEIGWLRVQCGTVAPFTGTSTTILSLDTMSTSMSSIVFGARTIVYAHNGLGSPVTHTMSVVNANLLQ